MSRRKTTGPEKPYIQFAKRFKQICRDNPKNITKIAEDLSVQPESVYAWRRGDQLPGGLNLLSIKEYFRISIDWLLTGKDYVESADRTFPQETIERYEFLRNIVVTAKRATEQDWSEEDLINFIVKQGEAEKIALFACSKKN